MLKKPVIITVFTVCFLALMAGFVKSSHGQDGVGDPFSPFDPPPAYEVQQDPGFQAPHAPVYAPSYAPTTEQLSVDDLEALLPAHLRQPLPADIPQRVSRSLDDLSPAMDSLTPLAPLSTEPPSTIETFYRAASGNPTLAQYGYDLMAAATPATIAPAAGAVSDDYILGPGDRLTVSFLGERKDRNSYRIDRTGALVIDHLPPIAAAGKTMATLREDLQHVMNAQSYHGEIYVTLDRVRQIGVLVAGHVKRPGRHAMTPLQTVIEALDLSGGITRDGSLRQIKLVREGKTTIIDLYAVMNGLDAQTMPPLADGDRIIVPPLGSTIAVTGDVRQPAIYELAADEKIKINEALMLAGGPLSRGQNRATILTPRTDGTRMIEKVSMGSGAYIRDGTIISIDRTQDRATGLFTLAGETRKPGAYPLVQYPKLSRVLRHAEAFGDDVYPLLGVVSRRRDSELVRDLIAFSPQDLFAGRADITLQDGDSVRLLSRTDVQTVMKRGKSTLPPLIETFIREHAVSLLGAVRLPGQWPVAGPVPIRRVLDVAGGPLNDADMTRAEINRNDVGLMDVSMGAISRRDVVDLNAAGSEAVTVTFGDAVRIPDRFEAVTRQAVTLRGEVRNPGTYDLMRGDTLLTLIDRAGGLTDQAYPLGAVFSRAAERRREKEKFAIAARDLERSIALAANNDEGKVDMAQMALAKDLADELKTIDPVGRITVQADPSILRREPEQDILLEDGDRIYVPKRPLSVRVTGEVLSPAALQFRADKDSGDYVSEAGGYTLHADKGRMFILYPNGSAQPIRGQSWTKMKPLMITPGSTIVVPRDPKPFDFIESAKDITQILSNLAITSIYAEDLIDRN